MLRHMSQTVVSCSAATTTIPLSSIYNNITAAAYQPHANPIFVVPPFPWSDLGTETTRLRFFMSLQFWMYQNYVYNFSYIMVSISLSYC